MREMSTARCYWFAGNLLGVVFTACLTVSNKDLLNRFGFLSGAGTLLFLHRSASFVFSRLTDTCGSSASSAKFAPRVPLSMLAVACVTSNVSIVLSFFVLREASVAFHQVSRLLILPLSAAIDRILYGKRRTVLELSGICLIAYGYY